MPSATITPVRVESKTFDSGKTVYNVAVMEKEERVSWSTWDKTLADGLEASLNSGIDVEYREQDRNGWTNKTIEGVAGIEKPKRNFPRGPDEDRADQRAKWVAAAISEGLHEIAVAIVAGPDLTTKIIHGEGTGILNYPDVGGEPSEGPEQNEAGPSAVTTQGEPQSPPSPLDDIPAPWREMLSVLKMPDRGKSIFWGQLMRRLDFLRTDPPALDSVEATPILEAIEEAAQ